jgi:hypothetical protein
LLDAHATIDAICCPFYTYKKIEHLELTAIRYSGKRLATVRELALPNENDTIENNTRIALHTLHLHGPDCGIPGAIAEIAIGESASGTNLVQEIRTDGNGAIG